MVTLEQKQSQYSKLRSHWLTRGAFWVVVGRGVSFLIQAGYFVLLAKLLSPFEYGKFSGAFALVNTITPYSALGAGMLFMRYVTEDRRQAGVYWGNALLTMSIMTVLLCGILGWLGPRLTGIHQLALFLLLTLANCLFGQIPMIAGTVFQSFEKMHAMSALNTLTNVSRLLVLVVLKVSLGQATALQWTVGVTIASFLAAVVSVIWVHAEIRDLSLNFSLFMARMKEGLGFSFAGTTQAVYNDVDKTVLSHYQLNAENGFYTLAYRVIDFVNTPIGAIDLAVLPRYFRLARQSKGAVLRLALQSLGVSVLLGLVLAGLTYLGAPLLSRFVGVRYAGAVTALRLLCFMPLLRGLHSISGSALTGMGRQSLRTCAQFFVAIVNLVGNIMLVPRLGWIACAYLSLASDGLLAVLNLAILTWVAQGRTSVGQEQPA